MMRFSRHHRTILVCLLILSEPTFARTTSQFRHFFPTWSGILAEARDVNCTAQRDAYFDPATKDSMAAFNLADCMLDCLSEFRKTEMGIVSLLFGLLPSILSVVGPSTEEISLLASRRPVLAVLLSIPQPSIRFENKPQDQIEFLEQPVRRSIRSISFLAYPPVWLQLLVSLLEYVLAAAAVANSAYQAYLLAYWTVTVSTIAINSDPLSQAFAPLLWLFLVIIVHVLGCLHMNLKYSISRPRNLLQWLRNEITPCVYGEPPDLRLREEPHQHRTEGFEPMSPLAFWESSVYQAKVVGVWVIFVYGTVILSSQIFISLGDSIPVLARFLLSAILCRWILVFELQGMRQATDQAGQKTGAELTNLMSPSEQLS